MKFLGLAFLQHVYPVMSMTFGEVFFGNYRVTVLLLEAIQM